MMSRNSFSMVISLRMSFLVFLTGKVLRFAFFFLFLFFLLQGTKTLAGYDVNQALFFFLTFNVIDVVSQFVFREVYRFRPMIVNGEFDSVLSKPINPLFRVLMGGADVIDLITIPPLFFAVWVVGSKLSPDILHTFYYLILLLNGLLIAAAFHIFVLSMGIITTEVDHTIMIYRDMTSLGRFPVDIYKQPLQGFLTYLVPVGLMVTLPAKALMGLVSPVGILSSFAFGILVLLLSLRFWNFAVKKYSSASS
jgi:ABC-2 type transport system permease protein